MTIGESIRYHRKRLTLTQAQLAERLNVTTQAVSRWENDTGLPDISMAVPLARALGITTDELLRFGERRSYWEQCWQDTLLRSGEDPEQLLQVCLAALQEFPYDRIFLHRAAVDMESLAETVEDPKKSSEYIGKALSFARSAAEMDPDNQTAKERYRRLKEKVTYSHEGFCVLKRRQT